MGVEIERKFLVIHEALPELKDGQHIIQGYLAEKPSIRFRIINEKIIITIKKAGMNGSRFELETFKDFSTEEERRTLQALSIFPVIEKVRYKLPYAGLVWEIDVYQGENNGLVTADVELPYFDYPILFPPWIDEKADITWDERYFNTNLGLNPFNNWRDKKCQSV